jgi:hypothetical protein
MTASPNHGDSQCEECECPEGGYICRACAKDGFIQDMLTWLERQRTVAPGLTNSEVALIERLVADLEAT